MNTIFVSINCHVIMRHSRFTPTLRVINMLGSKEEREKKRLKIMEQKVMKSLEYNTNHKTLVNKRSLH